MSEKLARERDAISRSGRLHWAHWGVIGLSLLATLAAWQFSKNQVATTNRVQFDRYASQVVELINERMQNYEEGLWGGVAAIRASGGQMSRGEWREFASALRIDLRYPGINGIGVIHNVPSGDLAAYLEEQRFLLPDFRIHPSHANPDRFPITYIEPAASNAAAIGLNDRGLLRPGYKADINVIDYDGLRLHAPEVVYDLPSGGRRLIQKTEGYAATIVSGVPVQRDGVETGMLPGRLVRGPQ